MPFATIGYTLGRILLLFAPFFLLPAMFAAGYGEDEAITAFFAGAILTAFAGGILIFTYRGVAKTPAKRHMLVVPLVGWLAGAFFAGIPIVLTGAVPNFGWGIFEALSGLTTTGATVVEDLDGALKSVLFWRATLQWVGGIATLAFVITITPPLDLGGASLANLALPHGESGSLPDRVRGVATLLLPVYSILTLAATASYRLAGMPFFDALCHAMATVSSGGFSTRNDSLAAFNAPLVELAAIPFMLLAATNFTYHWSFLKGRYKLYQRDPEIILILLALVVGTVLIYLSEVPSEQYMDAGFLHNIRIALVVTASALSTTGFSAAGDSSFTLLGGFAICALLFMGGGMASTAGGLKALRLLILFRHGVCELARLAHPSSISPLKYLKRRVSESALFGVLSLYFAFLVSLALFTVAFAATGQELASAFFLSLTALSNAGAILYVLDPAFSGFTALGGEAQTIYGVAMMLGRLEIIAILALLLPGFWRR